MFTGLVETVGMVAEITRRSGALRLSIASSLPAEELATGESVAVDGVCLTITGVSGDRFSSDVIPETLERTTLGKVRRGSRVNLERSLRLDDRLGGHLVQGHVDATSRVRGIDRRGGDHRVRLWLVPALRRFIAEKGSVAIQGVSLTVSGVSATLFEVALIPETLTRTTLGALARGDHVNVEVDLLARYLERLLEMRPARSERAAARSSRSRRAGR